MQRALRTVVAVGDEPPGFLGFRAPAPFDREIGEDFEAFGPLAGARDGVLPEGFHPRIQGLRRAFVQRVRLVSNAEKIPVFPLGFTRELFEGGPIFHRDEGVGDRESDGCGRGEVGGKFGGPLEGLGRELTGVEPLNHRRERVGAGAGFFLQALEQFGKRGGIGETRDGEAHEEVREFGGGIRLKDRRKLAGAGKILAAQRVGEQDAQGLHVLRTAGAHALERGVRLLHFVRLRGEQLGFGQIQLERFILRRGGERGLPVGLGFVGAAIIEAEDAGDFVELQRVARGVRKAFEHFARGGKVVETQRGVGPAVEIFDAVGFEQRDARTPENGVAGAEQLGDLGHDARGGDAAVVELQRAAGGDDGVGVFFFLQQFLGLGDDGGFAVMADRGAAFPFVTTRRQRQQRERDETAEGPIRPQRGLGRMDRWRGNRRGAAGGMGAFVHRG